MCETTELVPIPEFLWNEGGIKPREREYDVTDGTYRDSDWGFDETHPEYGINEKGEKCFRLDTCIIPAIKALWAQNIVTISCCCGHDEAKYGVITIKRPPETDTYIPKEKNRDPLAEELS